MAPIKLTSRTSDWPFDMIHVLAIQCDSCNSAEPPHHASCNCLSPTTFLMASAAGISGQAPSAANVPASHVQAVKVESDCVNILTTWPGLQRKHSVISAYITMLHCNSKKQLNLHPKPRDHVSNMKNNKARDIQGRMCARSLLQAATQQSCSCPISQRRWLLSLLLPWLEVTNACRRSPPPKSAVSR